MDSGITKEAWVTIPGIGTMTYKDYINYMVNMTRDGDDFY